MPVPVLKRPRGRPRKYYDKETYRATLVGTSFTSSSMMGDAAAGYSLTSCASSGAAGQTSSRSSLLSDGASTGEPTSHQASAATADTLTQGVSATSSSLSLLTEVSPARIPVSLASVATQTDLSLLGDAASTPVASTDTAVASAPSSISATASGSLPVALPKNKRMTQELLGFLHAQHFHGKTSAAALAKIHELKLARVKTYLRAMRENMDRVVLLGQMGRPRVNRTEGIVVVKRVCRENYGLTLIELFDLVADKFQNSFSSFYRAIQAAKITRRRFEVRPVAALTESVRKERLEYAAKMASIDPARLICLDETSVNSSHTRTHYWGEPNIIARQVVGVARSDNVNVLMAISIYGIVACECILGSYNTDRFRQFIETNA